ncbi:RluA family pseudouridine synthase [Bacillaceae bacterium W0354]
MNVPILYEDNHLLVVAKPVNIPVQGDSSGDEDLLSFLKNDLKKRYNKPGQVYLALVHRLDRPVGGVMVFAKTSKAASRLSDLIRKNELEKQYLAITKGKPNENKGQLVDYLVKNRTENIVHTTHANTPKAKKAVLDYEVIESNHELSLLKIQLHTGRPHQIRVQLSSRDCPIYGDQKYGKHVNKPGQQIALWSYELAFKHPSKDEEVRISSLPPNAYPWNIWKYKMNRLT